MNQNSLSRKQAPNAAIGWNIEGPHTGNFSGAQTRYWGGNDGAVMYGNGDDDGVKTRIDDETRFGEIGNKIDLSEKYWQGLHAATSWSGQSAADASSAEGTERPVSGLYTAEDT